MINVSTAFRKKLYNDERDYINALRFTLTDGTVLNVGHEHIMSNGITVDDAVGDDNKFNALGAVICNSLTVILYNNDEIYSNYVFEGATCEYTTGLEVEDDGTLIPENLDMGVYTVDSASYSDYTITLTLLDNMEQFDRPYNSLLVYPATLLEIVRDACTNCGVSLSTTSLRFPHDDYVAPVRPSSTDTTYREVLGWCATIAGCFAKCDRQGDLVFRWFDTDALENTDNDFDGGIFDEDTPYSTGDNVNGGTFNPWNTGDDAVADEFTVPIPYHYITNLSTQNIGVDDTVISGVSITVKTDGTEDTTDTEVFVEGTSDFMIQITDNPFITVDTAEDILDWLSTQLIGLSFRQCNVSHPNDPTIEAGDVGILWDKKGDQHNILITRVTFSPLAYQTIVCGVETPSKNQSARVTEATKAYVETRKQLKEQKNAYDLAIEELQGEIENSNGLYTTEVEQPDHSVKIYYHNKPLLAESDIQMLFSTTGFTVTANGTDTSPTWYGLTVNGQFLASVIQTISLFFDYASGGTLTLGGANNGDGILRILDATGNQIGIINNTGATFTKAITMISGSIYTTMNTVPVLRYYLVEQELRTIHVAGLLISSQTLSTGASFNGLIQTNHIRLVNKESSYNDFQAFYNQYFHEEFYFKDGLRYVMHRKRYGDNVSVHDIREVTAATNLDFDDKTGSTANINSIDEGITFLYGTEGMAFGSTRTISASSLPRINGYIVDLRTIDVGFILRDGEFYVKAGTSDILQLTSGDLLINNRPVAYDSSSSRRYKHDIEELIDSKLDPHKLLDLAVKQFIYNDDAILQYKDMKGQLLPGFIAEEVAEIYPSAVIRKNGEVESWDERRIIPGMLALIQEQHKKIEEQEEKIQSLEERLAKLETFIKTLTDDGR